VTVDPLAQHLVTRLAAADATLATAESLTGGLLGAMITTVPGASAVYRGGVVAYATELKVSLLGVPAEVVAEYGVISRECAAAMALSVRDRAGATYGLGLTGVAGPDLQEGRPAGTVFVGLATPAATEVVELALVGDRYAVRTGACRAALDLLLRRLGGHTSSTDPGRPGQEETHLG